MLLDADRLLNTVEQVLRAGQASHKHSPIQKTEIDFSTLVQECVDVASVRHHLQPGALRYEASVNGNAKVKGDPEELRTAVSNVLENAVKYSGNRVDIAVRLHAMDDRRLVLQVQDKGVGIPAHELKRVFKRFYRVQSRGLRNIKGTGLGLFIVRSIARKHGGNVFAASEGEGKGTTITMELPRSAA
jgi:signal transduction histidine kinase